MHSMRALYPLHSVYMLCIILCIRILGILYAMIYYHTLCDARNAQCVDVVYHVT